MKLSGLQSNTVPVKHRKSSKLGTWGWWCNYPEKQWANYHEEVFMPDECEKNLRMIHRLGCKRYTYHLSDPEE